jgi:two-component system, chemotaxis family, response regulator Rcp1
MSPRAAGRLQVLLVEDNPGDVDLVGEAVRELPCDLTVARDGFAALELLQAGAADPGARRPDLILLDLNLPRMDGREVLAAVKRDPALLHIPVVVLSSSRAQRDLLDTYRMHANCFVTKPVDLERFLSSVAAVVRFWTEVVTLPTASHAW